MSFRFDERGVLLFEPWERHGWLRHGFSSAAVGDFRDQSPASCAALFGFDEGTDFALVRQTHSDRVVLAEEALDALPERLEADGLVGGRAGVAMGVRVADCGPVLIVDPEKRVAAAVHAGWRGAAQGIVGKAVKRLTAELGACVERLEAVVGPCIGRERYEVGEEVAEQFEPEVIVRPEGAPRPFLNLAEANRRQLIAAGLHPQKTIAADFCTYDDVRFYSHRRQGVEAGRMMAAIGVEL